MKNLLTDSLTQSDIMAVLQAQPRTPLLPPSGDKRWSEAFAKAPAQSWMETICQAAMRDRSTPAPELTDELYRDFQITGLRKPFEIRYFARRRRLARAAMCALQDASAENLAALEAEMREVFGEESWTLPAHTKDATGRDPMNIDLFAAESANLFAELVTLFGAVLPADFVAQIRRRLRTQSFENYLDADWHWTRSLLNWNAVCHQGVLGAALAIEDDVELVAQMLMKARAHLPLFLQGFTADGGTSEGPGYWVYGFGWFCELNRQLETRTGSELSLVEGEQGIDEHVRHIARFGPQLVLSNGKLVNFSDGVGEGTLRPPLLAYLGARFDDDLCRAATANAYHTFSAEPFDVHSPRCDLFFLTQLFLRCPSEIGRADTVPADSFFPDLGVLVAHGRDVRGRLWEFAAKAGHNSEHHNHNDCGSFLLNLDGQRLLLEIGAPEYVKEFFSPARYEFLAARSRGHSVPLVNGCEQLAGEKYAAKILECTTDAHRSHFVVDITACYDAEAGLTRAVRTFELDKARGELRVGDEVELTKTQSVESALIAVNATREGNAVRVVHDGVSLLITPEDGTEVGGIETCDYRTHGGSEAQVVRIRFQPRLMALSCRIGYSVTAG
ncbi:MAG TPA: heparinase II/III family protein [Abditibacteriaceae bacterium]|jgi:hypothetical protein